MTVTRLREGLWRWTAPHPEWNGDPHWGPAVGSVYLETPDAVLLFDPLVPEVTPDETRFWAALDRDVERLRLPVAVMLTCRWHVRSAHRIRERYGARVLAPGDQGHGWGGLVSDRLADEARPFAGVVALVTGSPDPNEECVYVLQDHGAVVIGDILLGAPAGLTLAPASWYDNSDEEREWYRSRAAESLARVLAYEPRIALPAHGEPVLDAAPDLVARALGRA